MKISPCKDCKERHEKCHADCEKYKAFQAELKATKDWLKEQLGGEYYSSQSVHYNTNMHRYENKPRGINQKAYKTKKGGAG